MASISRLYFKDTSFASLMRKRVYNILLFASKYAVFTIEEDGRIDEQIFNEYTSLNLRYPPRFTLVSTEEEAEEKMRELHFDLIIAMPTEGHAIFQWMHRAKEQDPLVPIVLLTPFNRNLYQRLEQEDMSSVDYVFHWLGNPDLLLAIIKLVEDEMNVDEDIRQVGLQTILFVEDNIRFYSAILPMLYKHLFLQSRAFMTEALNPHEQMLRMRGRPKILLARSYAEASALYRKYSPNMLGVITDAEFPLDGAASPTGQGLGGNTPQQEACRRLLEEIRQTDPYIPIIVESSNRDNRRLADHFGATFLNKQAQTLLLDLRNEVTNRLGFGEFRFKDPATGKVVMRCKNLKELQNRIFDIPDESFLYHVTHNDVSRWLYSRALFPLAEYVKQRDPKHFTLSDMQEEKRIIHEAILDYRRIKNRGVVAQFRREQFDHYSNFARIGGGSMGSKGRGLAFIDAMIKRHVELEDFAPEITIPKTIVLCTDIFSEYMEANNLYPLALSDAPDSTILSAFLEAPLPAHIEDDLRALLDVLQGPIAVRSSSLLEDTQYQPFAGIYSTYMIPHCEGKEEQNYQHLTDAIRAVYASVFFSDSKAYMTATKNVIDEEKMAVVIQEVVGLPTQGEPRYFYPSFSGVARSLNFYPIGNETTEEGVAEIALGLGKYIVDGGRTLRFSPAHPQHVLQTSTTELALRDTQTSFLCLNLSSDQFHPELDDGFNLCKHTLEDADREKRLRWIASTYNMQSGYLYDNVLEDGIRVATFNNILHHGVFPLAPILQSVLQIAANDMGCPVEIEFAVNLPDTFYLLQVRPIVENKVMVQEDLDALPDESLLLRSRKALGQGVYENIADVVWVDPDLFRPEATEQIRREIRDLNQQLLQAERPYLLIGPGRWGSSDPWLGIPVKWPEISGAAVIVECNLPGFAPEPSQGTHFFQNLTSMGAAYMTVDRKEVDFEWLKSQLTKTTTTTTTKTTTETTTATAERVFTRHLRLEAPLPCLVDGLKQMAVVKKQ